MPIFDDFEFTGELERPFSGIGKTNFSADLEGAAESGGRGAASGAASVVAAGSGFGAAAGKAFAANMRGALSVRRAQTFGAAIAKRIGEAKADPKAFGARIAERIGEDKANAARFGARIAERIGTAKQGPQRWGRAIAKELGESKQGPQRFGRLIAVTIGRHGSSARRWGRVAGRAAALAASSGSALFLPASRTQGEAAPSTGQTQRVSGRQRATLGGTYLGFSGRGGSFFGGPGRGFGAAQIGDTRIGIGGVLGLGLAITGIGQLADLSRSLIEASAQFETFERTVRATESSAEAASERWQRLLDIAEQTVGIDVTGLVRFNSIMRAAGIEAGRVDSVLLSVVKSVSELGRPSYVAIEAMQQFTDAITQSHLTVRDWRAIVSRVPQFLAASSIALEANVRSVNDFRDAADALGISISEAVLRSLEQLQTTAVGLQGTYVAAVDRFQEATFVLRATFGEPFKDAITPIIERITAGIRGLTEAYQELDPDQIYLSPLSNAAAARLRTDPILAALGLPSTRETRPAAEALYDIIEAQRTQEQLSTTGLGLFIPSGQRTTTAERAIARQQNIIDEARAEFPDLPRGQALRDLRVGVAELEIRDALIEIERRQESITQLEAEQNRLKTEGILSTTKEVEILSQIAIERSKIAEARQEERNALQEIERLNKRRFEEIGQERRAPAVPEGPAIATDEAIDRVLEIVESRTFREAAERLRIRDQFAGDLPGLTAYVDQLAKQYQAAEAAQVRLGLGLEGQAEASEVILQTATRKFTLDETGLDNLHQVLQVAREELKILQSQNSEREKRNRLFTEAGQSQAFRSFAEQLRTADDPSLLLSGQQSRLRREQADEARLVLETEGRDRTPDEADRLKILQERVDLSKEYIDLIEAEIKLRQDAFKEQQRVLDQEARALEQRQQLQESIRLEVIDDRFAEGLRTGRRDPQTEIDRLTGELGPIRQETGRLLRIPELTAAQEAQLRGLREATAERQRHLRLAESQLKINEDIAKQQLEEADRLAASRQRRQLDAQSDLDALRVEGFGRAIETLNIPLEVLHERFRDIAATVGQDYQEALVRVRETGTETAEVTRLERILVLLNEYIDALEDSINAEERRRREAERALRERQRAYQDALELEQLYQDARRFGFTDAVSALELSRLEEFEVIKDATEAAIREEERLNNERIRQAERTARQYQRIWERAYEGIADTAIDALFDTDLDFGERLTRVAQEGLKDLASFYIRQQLNNSGGGGGTNLPGLLQGVLGGGRAAQTGTLSGGSSAAGVPGVDSFVPGFNVGAAQAGGGSALGGLASSALTDVVLPIAIADRLVSTRETGSLVGNLLQGAYEDILRPGFSFISRLFHDPQSDRYAYQQGSNIARAFEADHPDARRNARDFADNFSQGFLSESQNVLGGGDLNIIINLGENDDAIIRYTVRQRELMEQGQIEMP